MYWPVGAVGGTKMSMHWAEFLTRSVFRLEHMLLLLWMWLCFFFWVKHQCDVICVMIVGREVRVFFLELLLKWFQERGEKKLFRKHEIYFLSPEGTSIDFIFVWFKSNFFVIRSINKHIFYLAKMIIKFLLFF